MTPTADTRHLGRRSAWAVIALSTLLAGTAACGSDGDPSAGPGHGPGATRITSAAGVAVHTGGGWIGGGPEFEVRGGEVTAAADADGAGARAAAPPVAGAAPAPTTVVAAVDGNGTLGSALRAGSVDDNADHAGFLAYLDRATAAGITGRPWDATGRIVVRVQAADGSPAPGVAVQVAAGGEAVATLRTTADGTIRFLPGAYGAPAASYTFSSGGSSTDAAPGAEASLATDATADRRAPAVDVLFLLDATGSMGDEIDQLKAGIATVSTDVAAAVPGADVRFGMTLYRDDEDSFVTATYDFTNDVDAFGRALDEVVAGGGGDYPEALDEGLDAALHEPSWRPAGEALQLVFVVGDAPPQVGRQLDVPYTASLREAGERGIKIFPIASSGTDDVAELVFRQLAQATGARFVFLAYGAGGAALGSRTDITSTDDEELSLDALVTRLVLEEVGARTGTTVTTPPATSTTTSTTRPPGQ